MPRRKSDVDDIFDSKGSEEATEEPTKNTDTKSRAHETLDTIGRPASTIRLGLGPLPGRQYIFIGGNDEGDDAGTLWYTLDGNNNNRLPVKEPCLTGYLKALRIVPKKYKDKWNYKLDVIIQGDREYAIRSGMRTTFSIGLLQSLIKAQEAEELSGPLAFYPTAGNEGKVVFSNVANAETGWKYIMPKDERDSDPDVSSMIFDLQNAIGCEVQSKDSIQEDKDNYETKYSGSSGGGNKRESRDEFE